MMKVLYYNHTAKVSGAERVLLLMLSQLDSNEFSARVLCPSGELTKLVEAAAVPCLTVEELQARFTRRPDHLWRYLQSFARVIRQVRQQVRQSRPDLIHANSIRAGLVMTAATVGLRVPVIWHLHDLLPRHPFSTAIRCFALGSSRLRLIAVSQATADRFNGWLLRWFPRRVPMTVILNAADTEKFQPDAASRLNKRAELKLDAHEFVVGIVGQITERKGQAGLLRAFARVVKSIPQAKLLIIGAPLFTEADQQYQQQLLALTEQLGLAASVSFLGARTDVPALLRALDVLVVNSLAEPCGLIVLEGMSSGLPVIATNVGGNPEMIEHGHSGWLVPSQDESSLAETMLKLHREPHLRLVSGQNARARVQQHFSIAGFSARLLNVYRAADRASAPHDVNQTMLRTKHYSAELD